MLVDSATYRQRVDHNGRTYVVDVPYNRKIKCKVIFCVFVF